MATTGAQASRKLTSGAIGHRGSRLGQGKTVTPSEHTLLQLPFRYDKFIAFLSTTDMAEKILDLERHFNMGGRVHVAQVCSPDPHSAAPVSDSRGEWESTIYTCAADDLSDFDHDDPDFLAQRVVVDISTRLPNVPEAELAAFYDEVVTWICDHRRVAAEKSTWE